MNSAENLHTTWTAACGGTEKPFMFQGKEYLYMWNAGARLHAHYCITDDVFLGDKEAEQLFNLGKLKLLI